MTDFVVISSTGSISGPFESVSAAARFATKELSGGWSIRPLYPPYGAGLPAKRRTGDRT